jgi:drug/metabolite transporter (DMT)-like permease
MRPVQQAYRGLALAFAGVIVLSPDALIIRSIDEGPWTIVFWRGVFASTSLILMATVLNRGRIVEACRAVGRIGLVVALFQSGAGTCFVLAITQTEAANVLVIVSTAPLFTALFARVFLGEPIPLRTWVAIGCVIVAVAIVFQGSMPSGRVTGDVFALLSALSQAAASTAVRRAKAVNMLPALSLASVFSATLAFFIGATIPDPSQLGLMALHGLVLAPSALALLTTAVRYLPAAEVSLINQLEIVLGPIWIWAVLDERPGLHAIVGGVIIVATLTIHTLLGVRARRRDVPALVLSAAPSPTGPGQQGET